MIENLNEINKLSLVVDEYNNYYTISIVDLEKKYIKLSNFLYTITRNRCFSRELIEDYMYKSISEFTSKELADCIEFNKKQKTLFKLEDLKKFDIKIYFEDCTRVVKNDYVKNI